MTSPIALSAMKSPTIVKMTPAMVNNQAATGSPPRTTASSGVGGRDSNPNNHVQSVVSYR